MALGFSFTVALDSQQAQRRLSQLGVHLEPGRILNLIGAKFLWWVDQNFRREGYEKPWTPLAPSTIKHRGIGAKILQDNGVLKRSFVKNVNLGAKTVVVGTEDWRAAWHHLGTSRGLPSRPLLPSQPLAQQLAFESLEGYVRQMVQRATPQSETG